MEQDDFDYFQARAEEEDRLAASSHHPGVKARHEAFAAEFRARARKAQEGVIGPD